MGNPQMATDRVLEGRTAFITGASRGLGRAMAAEFAARGARVALIARSESELMSAADAIQAAGGVARAWVGDVTDARAMRRIVDEVEGSLGPIEVLVNNAGAIAPIAPLADADDDEWWRTVEVNLRGPALCTRLILPRMQARRRGRIINLVSGAAAMSFTYYTAYVASKTALMRLTECVASEARPYGIVVLAMEPGTVATAMSEWSLQSEGGRRWIPEFRRVFDAGLNSPPDRVAARAVELASGKADDLSGRYIPLAEDLDRLAANASHIVEEQMYSLRMRRLDAAPASAAIDALRKRMESASTNVLQLRATIAASREQAFGLWTDPREVERWFPAETGWRWSSAPVVDATTEGVFDLCLTADAGHSRSFGRFRQVDPGRRLVLDWSWDSSSPGMGAGSGTVVTVDFLDADAGTEVVVIHEGFPNESARDAFIAEWARRLGQMKTVAAS